MNLHIFQHESSCGPGALRDWMAARQIEAHWTRFHLGDALPALSEVKALIILGGTMNAYQDAQFPHLKPLREFTREALHARKKVLGLCLGAQIMADALGSRVTRAVREEKGWLEIVRREDAAQSPLLDWLPARHSFVSWHGDTFAVPAGAVHGASSDACVQAFSWGEHALALQFHPEADAEIVQGWLESEPTTQHQELRSLFLSNESLFRTQKELLFVALDAWIGS